MLLAILLLSAAAPPSTAWANFGRAHVLERINERVEIMTDGSDPATHQINIRLRYTRTTLRDGTTLWADSRHCPAIREMLVSMRDIEMPRPAPYGVPGNVSAPIPDGTGYSLTAPSSFSSGGLTITSNIGSPLATWVDRALKMLQPCWSPAETTR